LKFIDAKAESPGAECVDCGMNPVKIGFTFPGKFCHFLFLWKAMRM